jgi:hypothetical protein
MRTLAHHVAVAAMLLASGCDHAAIKASESLVGAKNPPSAAQLSRETIQINRWGGPRGDHFLSYELLPDNSLTVTHALRQPGGERTLARESFRLSANLGNEVRVSLARVRPETLRGIEYDTLPTGCPVIIDASPEVVVVFIGAKQRIGVSPVPQEGNCNSPQARQARQLVSHVIGSLPANHVATGFPDPN